VVVRDDAVTLVPLLVLASSKTSTGVVVFTPL
jgi:hypothetical protein